VQELSKRDRRFRLIWQTLVEEGVTTEGGKMLQRWTGTGWEAL